MTEKSNANGGHRKPADHQDRPSDLASFIPHRVIVTARRISQALAYHYDQAFKLSVAELSVLTVVGQNIRLSPTAIAGSTSMDKVRVSRATAVLVGKGLLRQNPDPRDGRGRVLRLTKKGQAVYDGINPIMQDIETALTAHFGKSDLQSLNRILSRLDTALDGISQGPDQG